MKEPTPDINLRLVPSDADGETEPSRYMTPEDVIDAIKDVPPVEPGESTQKDTFFIKRCYEMDADTLEASINSGTLSMREYAVASGRLHQLRYRQERDQIVDPIEHEGQATVIPLDTDRGPEAS